MELLANLGLGFETALSPWNLLYCFVGVLLGTAVGVLPGLGPIATIAMLLPLTFSLPPVSALIMLAGIYYGAQYGGSTTAILINLPGESSSVVTAIDGYQMAKQGRAGQALATAALGSFFAGSVATFIVALFAPPLANVALQFGPAEYFSLMVLGLVTSVALASGSLLKAFTMVVLGLLLGLVGTDVETGTPRFTFELPELADGLNFVALSHGRVRPGRDHPQSRARAHPLGHGPPCQRADAVEGGRQADHRPGPARHRAGLAPGHPARRRGDAGQLRLLHHGEEALQEQRPVRQGGDRGRGGTRGRQQCRGADLVHPDADPGHPLQPGDGLDDRRPDHPGHHPRPQRGHRRAGPVLGPDRLDVGRQSDAGAA